MSFGGFGLNDLTTIGTVYLIFHYTSMLRIPIQSMTRQLNSLQKATASLVRISDLFQTSKTVLDGAGAEFSGAEQSVRFENVSFAYKTGEAVLRDVTFDIGSGRVLGLLGRTGSGKTTLVRLLVRLYDPDDGTVLLGDNDIRQYGVFDLREQISMVPQDVRLFHGTIRDNLTLFDKGVDDDRLLEVIDHLGVMPWFQAQPQIPHLRLLGWLLWAYSRCGVSTGVLIGLCAASLRGLATVSHQLWSLSG